MFRMFHFVFVPVDIPPIIAQGLGPLFKIKFSVKNTGQKPIADVPVSMTFNPQLYRVPVAAFKVRVCAGLCFVKCNSCSQMQFS